MFPYFVCGFGKNTLSILVRECFGADFPDVKDKKQVNYIYNYLDDLEAKTVLLETDYVDKDYLEDYSRYYVRCFNRYGERCARLHFFKNEFDHLKFESIIKNNDTEELKSLQKNYLGFVVIKPIPKTFIGKTCLKMYDSFNRDSYKTLLTKEYKAGLFGIDLSVNSVAFQEQDKVLSACATTAIWSSLHAIKEKDTREIPSSSEITLSAINHISDSSNSFPNNGLSNKQILRALDVEKLRHHQNDISKIKTNSKERVFNLIKTYIDSGFSIILGAEIYELDGKKAKHLDGHAVTVLGYNELEGEESLYIHDDRLGPYARARIHKIADYCTDFEDSSIKKEKTDWCIALQEKNDDGEWLDVKQFLVPYSMIIPTNKKVRIPASNIDSTCTSIVKEFNAFVEEAGDEGYSDKVTYKVSLENLSSIRKKVFNGGDIENKWNILTKNSPRFLWVAKFYYQGTGVFDMLFDATDIPQGSVVSNIIIYNKKHYDFIVSPLIGLNNSGKSLPNSGDVNFLSAVLVYLKEKNYGYMNYLDIQFGELRAPLYIKDEEVLGSRLQEQKDAKKYYGSVNRNLDDDFSGDTESNLIWAIAQDGALLIGEEIGKKGHPTLTGFKPARIAGELKKDDKGWCINSKSGRYSSSYKDVNALLQNAKVKFHEIYSKQEDDIRIEIF